MHLPLAGITVVELGHSVAAPFAGQVLGDLGARVIKIENPDGGDDARRWGPPFWHGSSATFQALNRNKLSAAIDLRDAADVARLRRFIVSEADVVLQNLRPGIAERVGLGASLRDEAPRLIHCSIGAFGAVGPLRERPGYDPLMQAFSGMMGVTGEPGRPPVRVGPSIVDIGAGLWAVIGIFAALESRRQLGRGCVVDTSLLETALAWMSVPAAIAQATGRDPVPTGSEAAMIAPYKAYRASDRFLVIAAGNDNLFRRLGQALGHPEWAQDECFASNEARVRNRERLNGLIDSIVGERPAAHWIDLLDAAGVPVAPLLSVTEVLAHEQTRALGMLQPTPDGAMQLMGLPLRFDGERPPVRSRPPSLGADGEQIPPSPPQRAVGWP